MDQRLSVKKIEASQGALLRELRLSALSDAPHAFAARLEDEVHKPAAEFEAEAIRQAGSETSTSFILFADNEPAGLIGAFFDRSPERRAFICALWVHPKARHAGGGALLVRAATDWLARRGARAIHAWVVDSNVPAKRLYQSLGFLPAGKGGPLPTNPAEWETLLYWPVGSCS